MSSHLELCLDQPWVDGGCGAVAIWLSPLGTELTFDNADAILTGEFAPGNAGASISSAGDVDGDGLVDLLIGDPGNEEISAAYVVTGPWEGVRSLADARARWTIDGNRNRGRSVAAVPDVDGDGFAELFVGGRNFCQGSGSGMSWSGQALYRLPPGGGVGSHSFLDAQAMWSADRCADAGGALRPFPPATAGGNWSPLVDGMWGEPKTPSGVISGGILDINFADFGALPISDADPWFELVSPVDTLDANGDQVLDIVGFRRSILIFLNHP